MNQMYRSFASGTSYTAINPNLQPMTNFGQEVGFDFKWREFTLSSTYFNNNLDNFIDFVTVCNTNAACAAPFITAAGLSPAFTTVQQYNNVGNATFQGIEIIGGWQPFSNLRLTARLHQHRRLSHQLATIRRWNEPACSSARCPNWTITAGAEWRPLPELALTAHLRSFPAYWNDTGHTQLNDAATIIDIGASYSPAKSVDIYASVQNLTNFQYLAHGLHDHVVRGDNGQRDLHPGSGNAAHRHRRAESEILKG